LFRSEPMKDSYVIRTEASRRAARRVSLCVVVAIALTGLLPATAFASTASVSGGTVTYTAGTENNNVTLSFDGTSYLIADPSATIADGGGCPVTDGQAACDGTSVTGIRVETVGGNDHIFIDPTVQVAAFLSGGGGTDTITSRNGVADAVFCGGGTGDSALLDVLDAWDGANCEQVDNGVDPAPISITDAPPSAWNSTSASLSFTSPDPQARFACSLDSGDFADCSSPAIYDGLGEGPHTFSVQATDEGGRSAPPVDYSWTIDLTGPTVTIGDGPTGAIMSGTATFAFSSEADATFQCAIDRSDWIDCTSPITYSNLPPGAHTFAVRATDPAGNTGGPAERSFTVVIPAPPTVAPASATPASSLVLISGHTVKVSKRGFASIALNCSGTKDCAGTLILATSKPVRFSRKRRRIVRLAEAKFVIPAGRTKKVKVHLTRRKVRLIRQLRHVKTDLIVRDLDHAGRARLSTRTVVLRAPR
jgi:hypothetical protein